MSGVGRFTVKMRRREPPPFLALYQHFDGGKRYRTAALLREDECWLAVCLDNEFRGGYEVTLHERLEDARAAIVAWVGEPREVTAEQVPGSVWRRLDHWRRTGDLDSDVV
jgi:hypothetical protein